MKNLSVCLWTRKASSLTDVVKYAVGGRGVNTSEFSPTSIVFYAVIGRELCEVTINERSDVNDVKVIYSLNECSEQSEAVGLAFDGITGYILLPLSTGELIAVDTLQSPPEVQKVLIFPEGLTSMSRSPDSEWILFISTQKIYFVSSMFSIVHEFSPSDLDEEENKLITVGWGKKETQFHGSAGKKAALAKKVEEPEATNVPSESYETIVTWRGDSSLFAVSYWCPSNKRRIVKVYNTDCALQNTSELIHGMEPTLSWKPSGNLIAFSQKIREEYNIAFLEKNGLQHGTFSLPPNIQVNNILWNYASNILTLICTQSDTGEPVILLWTTGNYHWYLKQKIRFPTPIASVFWDEDRTNRLYVVNSDGTFNTLEFIWKVDRSPGTLQVDPSYVAVIDGDKILLTSFKDGILPPPMSHWSLQCPSEISKVIFTPTEDVRSPFFMCALLFTGEVAFFSDSSGEPVLTSVLKWKDEENLTNMLPTLNLYHWLWFSPDTFIISCPAVLSSGSDVHCVKLTTELLELRPFVTKVNDVILADSIHSEEALIQTKLGELILLNPSTGETSPHDFCLPEPCPQMTSTSTGLYALSNLSRLYFNGELISGDVRSFAIHHHYLVYTTHENNLVLRKEDNTEESTRPLERGSFIIATHGNTVVMQLPRGNLETVQPRALNILTAGQLISDKKYSEAMHLMRRQRINLNLCVDYNPEEFIQDAPLIIKQVDEQWVTIFIEELKEMDVTYGVYKSFFKNKVRHSRQLDSKVKEVCSALLKAMEDSEKKDKYLLPILSCYVKIGEIAKAIDLASRSPEALKHLLFLVDVDALYIDALGCYNLSAALKFAEKSSQDPKEYIPYLNSLSAMNPLFMKYTIDKTLQKYSSALYHLSQCPGEENFAECLTLIKSHSLYSQGVDYFKNNPEKCNIILNLHGDYLNARRHFEEAALIYSRCGEYSKAMKAFSEAGQWENCMVVAKKLGLSGTDLEDVVNETLRVLRSSERFVEAAELCTRFLEDSETAVDILIEGKHWNRAIYTCELHNTPQLRDQKIVPALDETVDTLLEDLISNRKTFECHVDRLKEVRREKLEKKHLPSDGELDTQSEASSVTSIRTSSTRLTRNTRKLEKKMWSLKEGNPREEEALLAVLSQLIGSSEKLVGEVRSTCLVLLQLAKDEKAQELHSCMESLLRVIGEKKLLIWPEEKSDVERMDLKYSVRPSSEVACNWKLTLFVDS